MPKRHIPYFSFYPADFMNGVRGLTAQEIGVYTMLLCRIYEENGPIEANAVRLSTYCGMREKTFSSVMERLVILGKFTLENGMLSNRRADAEIQKRSDGLENNSKAGKASAQKRQEKQQSKSTTVEQPSNHTDTDTDTDTEVKEEAKASSKKRASRLPEDWQLPKQWGEWSMSQGMSELCVRREADKFKDYWKSKAGKDASKLDWQATWRNWTRSYLEKNPAPQLRAVGSGRWGKL